MYSTTDHNTWCWGPLTGWNHLPCSHVAHDKFLEDSLQCWSWPWCLTLPTFHLSKGAGLGSPFVFPGVHEEGRRLFCIPGNVPHCLWKCERQLPIRCACSCPSGYRLTLPSVGPSCRWDVHHSSLQLVEIWTLFSSPMLSLTHSWP